jgi:urease accessory protein
VRRGEATVLAACRSTLPLQVLAPLALDEPTLVRPCVAPEARACVAPEARACVAPEARACIVSMLNPTGSVLGGDHLRIDVCADARAHALLTTPSATRVHRTAGPCAVQEVRLSVGAGAALEWLPDHTIPHAGSAFRQRVRAHVAADATLVIVDAFAAGRVARGEHFRFRVLESALEITDDEGWLLHDRFVLDGEGGWDGLGFCEGAPYLVTVAVVAATPVAALARAARDALAGAGGINGGVGLLRRRGILVRCLASTAPALADAVRATWNAVRMASLGAGAPDLRKY